MGGKSDTIQLQFKNAIIKTETQCKGLQYVQRINARYKSMKEVQLKLFEIG